MVGMEWFSPLERLQARAASLERLPPTRAVASELSVIKELISKRALNAGVAVDTLPPLHLTPSQLDNAGAWPNFEGGRIARLSPFERMQERLLHLEKRAAPTRAEAAEIQR